MTSPSDVRASDPPISLSMIDLYYNRTVSIVIEISGGIESVRANDAYQHMMALLTAFAGCATPKLPWQLCSKTSIKFRKFKRGLHNKSVCSPILKPKPIGTSLIFAFTHFGVLAFWPFRIFGSTRLVWKSSRPERLLLIVSFHRMWNHISVLQTEVSTGRPKTVPCRVSRWLHKTAWSFANLDFLIVNLALATYFKFWCIIDTCTGFFLLGQMGISYRLLKIDQCNSIALLDSSRRETLFWLWATSRFLTLLSGQLVLQLTMQRIG